MKLLDCFRRVRADFKPDNFRFYSVRFTFVDGDKHCVKHCSGLFSELETVLDHLLSLDNISHIMVEYLCEVDIAYVAICVPVEEVKVEEICN